MTQHFYYTILIIIPWRICYCQNNCNDETQSIRSAWSSAKKHHTSTDYVYYDASRKHKKITKVSPPMIGKQPMYKFFIDNNGHDFPLRCMLDLGSTSFVISPNATEAFKIPVVRRTIKVKSKNVTGRDIIMDSLETFPLRLSFCNHCSYNPEDHAFEVMATSKYDDCYIPVWYLKKHNARGTTTSHQYLPHPGS